MNKKNDNNKKTGKRGYNILPKIFCILASIILWLYVSQVETTEYESTFNGLTVELVNTNTLESESGLSVYSGYGYTVDVTVSGKRSIINRYSSKDIRVYADVTGIDNAGKHYVTIVAEAPAGLKIVSLSESTVSVYADEIITRDIDVVTRIGNSVIASNYILGDPVPEYSVISVTGPKTTVNTIECAEIVLDLGEVTSTVSVTQTPVLKDKSGNAVTSQYVKMQYSAMKVTVPVETTKTLPLKVDYKNKYYNQSNATVTLEPSSVTVKGDPTVLAQLDSLTVATIDEKKITDDVTQVYILNLPEGVDAVDNVESVSVSVKHNGTVVRHYNVDTADIVVTGAEGKEYEILDKVVSVDLRGARTALSKITTDDITITVDLSRYENVSGNSSVPAVVEVDGEGETYYPIGDYTVQISIK